MPAHAFLHAAVACPACGTQLDDQVWFQWGFCISRAQLPETTYTLGDAIRWRECKDGTVPSWTYLYAGDVCTGGNMGTPDERHVIVRDWANTHEGPCLHCGVALGSTVVEIRDGRIVRAWITRKGELPEGEVHRVLPDGQLSTLVLGDHPMDLRRDD
jgi:hypothetical protein